MTNDYIYELKENEVAYKLEITTEGTNQYTRDETTIPVFDPSDYRFKATRKGSCIAYEGLRYPEVSYRIDPFSDIGNYTVVWDYNGAKTTSTVTLWDTRIKYIRAHIGKTTYNWHEYLDLSTLEVYFVDKNENILYYTDDYTTNVSSGTLLEEDFNLVVTSFKEGYVVSFRITVNPAVTGIWIETPPYKVNYRTEDVVSYDGLRVRTWLNDGIKGGEITDYNIDPEDGFIIYDLSKEVVIEYLGFTTSFMIYAKSSQGIIDFLDLIPDKPSTGEEWDYITTFGDRLREWPINIKTPNDNPFWSELNMTPTKIEGGNGYFWLNKLEFVQGSAEPVFPEGCDLRTVKELGILNFHNDSHFKFNWDLPNARGFYSFSIGEYDTVERYYNITGERLQYVRTLTPTNINLNNPNLREVWNYKPYPRPGDIPPNIEVLGGHFAVGAVKGTNIRQLPTCSCSGDLNFGEYRFVTIGYTNLPGFRDEDNRHWYYALGDHRPCFQYNVNTYAADLWDPDHIFLSNTPMDILNVDQVYISFADPNRSSTHVYDVNSLGWNPRKVITRQIFVRGWHYNERGATITETVLIPYADYTITETASRGTGVNLSGHAFPEEFNGHWHTSHLYKDRILNADFWDWATAEWEDTSRLVDGYQLAWEDFKVIAKMEYYEDPERLSHDDSNIHFEVWEDDRRVETLPVLQAGETYEYTIKSYHRLNVDSYYLDDVTLSLTVPEVTE